MFLLLKASKIISSFELPFVTRIGVFILTFEVGDAQDLIRLRWRVSRWFVVVVVVVVAVHLVEVSFCDTLLKN